MCSVRTVKVILLLIASLTLALAIALGAVSSTSLQFARDIGLFNEWNTSTEWSQRSIVQNSTLTPSGWTFRIWYAIYAYQFLWLAYCWSTVCRRSYDEGPFLCDEPDLAPNGLLVWHFISSVFNMAWIVLADRVDFERDLLVPQTCVLMAAAVSLYVALGSSYYALARDKKQLVSCNRRLEYWLVVVFVQNGISLYAAWATIASFLNLDFTLKYFVGLEQATSGFISLSILIALVAVYVIIDLTILDRATRFVFTPHLVVGWACAGSLIRNFVPWSNTTILTVVLASVAGLTLLLKLIAICIRTKVDPIFRANSYQVKQV